MLTLLLMKLKSTTTLRRSLKTNPIAIALNEMTQFTPLSREQKLLAEIIVQLGNVTEAIRAASGGNDSSDLTQQVATLQAEITTLTTDNASLTQQLANSSGLVLQLQQQVSAHNVADITPDNIQQVVDHLNFEVGE